MKWTWNKYTDFGKLYCQLVISVVTITALGSQIIPSELELVLIGEISPRKIKKKRRCISRKPAHEAILGQISPELLFVTLGTQTETGCIFNEAVSGHCEMKPGAPAPLSVSAAAL